MKEILERLDRMDAGFQRLETNIERLEGKLDTNIERLEGKLDTNIERLEGKFDTNIERLEGSMNAGFQKQGVQLEALQDGLKLALEGISGNRKVLDDKFAEVLEKLDERVLPVELASRHIARDLASLAPQLRAKRKKQV